MYTFRFNPVDNDAELTIDGVKVIDHWCATYLQGSKYLTKGVHDIQVWYFQGTPYAAALTLQWMGPDLPWETIPLRFGVTTLDVLAETSPEEPSPLPWDGLVSTALIVEAKGTGSYPPQSLTARVTSLRNGKVTLLELDKVSQQGNEAVFRGVSPASGIVDPAGPGSVAIVDYAGSEDEYNLALDFLDLLAVPDYLRMGIAWGEGREPDRPPATRPT